MPDPPTLAGPLGSQVAALERRIIGEVLGRERHNLSRAARVLDIDRNTLERKIASLDIPHQSQGSGRPVTPVPAPEG